MNLKYIVPIAVVLIVALLSYFYFVLRNKTQDVSTEQPFVALVDKDLMTKKRCVLAKEPNIPVKDSYPNIIEDGTSYSIDDLEIIKEIPIGSKLTIQSVELHKGGVSGATICYLFGTIKIESKMYPFYFSWGSKSFLNNNWTFPQSFWQEEGYKQQFTLPEL